MVKQQLPLHQRNCSISNAKNNNKDNVVVSVIMVNDLSHCVEYCPYPGMWPAARWAVIRIIILLITMLQVCGMCMHV